MSTLEGPGGLDGRDSTVLGVCITCATMFISETTNIVYHREDSAIQVLYMVQSLDGIGLKAFHDNLHHKKLYYSLVQWLNICLRM